MNVMVPDPEVACDSVSLIHETWHLKHIHVKSFLDDVTFIAKTMLTLACVLAIDFLLATGMNHAQIEHSMLTSSNTLITMIHPPLVVYWKRHTINRYITHPHSKTACWESREKVAIGIWQAGQVCDTSWHIGRQKGIRQPPEWHPQRKRRTALNTEALPFWCSVTVSTWCPQWGHCTKPGSSRSDIRLSSVGPVTAP